MKIIFILSALFLHLFGLPNQGLSQKASRLKDMEKLKKLEYDWLTAEFKMDTATIAPMMDERFMAIGLTRVSNKQQELDGMYENISQRLKNEHVIDSLYLDDIQIELFDNTAIVTFISVTKGKSKTFHLLTEEQGCTTYGLSEMDNGKRSLPR